MTFIRRRAQCSGEMASERRTKVSGTISGKSKAKFRQYPELSNMLQ